MSKAKKTCPEVIFTSHKYPEVSEIISESYSLRDILKESSKEIMTLKNKLYIKEIEIFDDCLDKIEIILKKMDDSFLEYVTISENHKNKRAKHLKNLESEISNKSFQDNLVLCKQLTRFEPTLSNYNLKLSKVCKILSKILYVKISLAEKIELLKNHSDNPERDFISLFKEI